MNKASEAALKEALRTGQTVDEDELCKLSTGFYRSELQHAFELVEQKGDWKAPIDSYCTSDEVKVVAAAIEFFTATKPEFAYCGLVTDSQTDALNINLLDHVAGTRRRACGDTAKANGARRFKVGDHVLYVKAVGYRMGPAGDH